jgi:hypothetical protein
MQLSYPENLSDFYGSHLDIVQLFVKEGLPHRNLKVNQNIDFWCCVPTTDRIVLV